MLRLPLFVLFISSSWGLDLTLDSSQIHLLHSISQDLFKASSAEDSLFYQQSWRLEKTHTQGYTYTSGLLLDSIEWQRNFISVDSRVGNPQLDNTTPLREHFGEDQSNHVQYQELPLQFDSTLIHNRLSQLHQKSYKNATYNFKVVQNNQLHRPKTIDSWFLAPRKGLPPSTHPVRIDSFDLIRRESLKVKLKQVSLIMEDYPEILFSKVGYEHRFKTKYYWDSEEAFSVQQVDKGRIQISLQTQAGDGMILDHFKEYPIQSDLSFPTLQQLTNDIHRLAQELTQLKHAPVAKPYSGPVLLEPEASAVFIHEVIGHRMESHRLKQSSDGQTFRQKIHDAIMDPQFDLVDDPTLHHHEGTPLNGHYQYDDQGVAARPAHLITNGVLQGFLESRSTSSDSTQSNGHGRGNIHLPAVSRMGNTWLQSSKGIPYDSLRQLFKQELKRQHLEFGYIFKNLSGGFTSTARGMPQSFKLTPLMALKVFTDDREPELVRGLDLVGTPLVSLGKIIASSDSSAVFNGFCGAESGWVPVSSIAPALLFQELEVESQYSTQVKAPKPYLKNYQEEAASGDLDVGIQTLNTLKNALGQLKSRTKENDIQPIGIHANLWTSHTQERIIEDGSLVTQKDEHIPELEINLSVGTDSLDQRFYQGNYVFESTLDNPLPLTLHPRLLNKYLYYKLEDLYISESERFQQKISFLNKHPRLQSPPQRPHHGDKTSVSWRECHQDGIDSLVNILKPFTKKIAGIQTSRLEIGFHDVQHFGLIDSSISAQNLCEHTLVYSAVVKDSKGKSYYDYYRWSSPVRSSLDLSDVQQQMKQVQMNLLNLKDQEDQPFYRGPVILKGQASGYFIHESLVESQMQLDDDLSIGSSQPELLHLIGRKFLPKEFNVYDLPKLKTIHLDKKHTLYGSYEFDHLGDSTQNLQIIQNGMMSQLFPRSIPRLFDSHPGQGFYRYNGVWPGNLFVSHTHPISDSLLRVQAISLAQEEGLDKLLIIEQFEEHDSFTLLDKDQQDEIGESFHSESSSSINLKNPTRMYWLWIESGEITLAKPMSFLTMDYNDLRLIRAASKTRTLVEPYAAYSLIVPDLLIELVDLRQRPQSF